MNRFLCIHGHFYQPPRENPWLEAIERQPSAAPYHDWNERIAAECYAPNAASRILSEQGQIERIVNNYAQISFNFGPTLLSWMQRQRPHVYEAILEADALGQRRFGGHGPAIAQVYNHLIMPLATPRDRRLQVDWGLADFHARFGRDPEGMWLAECAVDTDTLEALAERGILYTILAPNQARSVRPVGSGDDTWRPALEALDTKRPYVQTLPSGRTIALFFYDGPVSRAIAFERLLHRGERLANRLTEAFDAHHHGPQLVHVATDGETYGHHHKYGEMALSYALQYVTEREMARLTIYGEYLAMHPPEWEVRIEEDTSWSCAHGVERWRSDCGCHTGGEERWDQRWRAPLREALDWLRGRVEPALDEREKALGIPDIWRARDQYIEVILDRSPETIARFAATHLSSTDGEAPSPARVIALLQFMEIARHAQLMYTSCGWFFNDLSGVETTQILEYAARVIDLARHALGLDAEAEFLERLQRARSNIAREGTGRKVYNTHVVPHRVELHKVCAHYAILELFEAPSVATYCYEVEPLWQRRHTSGLASMTIGRVRVRSLITHASKAFEYGIFHMGDHNVDGGVRQIPDDERASQESEQAYHGAVHAFERAEFPALVRQLDAHFSGAHVFSLRSLIGDEQRQILDLVAAQACREATQSARDLYEKHAPLLRFLAEFETPAPESLLHAARVALQDAVDHALITAPKPPTERPSRSSPTRPRARASRSTGSASPTSSTSASMCYWRRPSPSPTRSRSWSR